MKIGCVVLAAGNAVRFGENKLQRLVNGKSMIRHALEAVPVSQLSDIVVVTQYSEIEALAKEFTFTAIYNDSPQLGQSHSLQLGLEAVSHCDAVLFLVADQPLLRRETVAQLVALYRLHPHAIACLSCEGVLGNPCLFPARFYDELRALRGDRGGRSIRKNHAADVVTLEVEKRELQDIDTSETLDEIDLK